MRVRSSMASSRSSRVDFARSARRATTRARCRASFSIRWWMLAAEPPMRATPKAKSARSTPGSLAEISIGRSSASSPNGRTPGPRRVEPCARSYWSVSRRTPALSTRSRNERRSCGQQGKTTGSPHGARGRCSWPPFSPAPIGAGCRCSRLPTRFHESRHADGARPSYLRAKNPDTFTRLCDAA